jgi:hypothetical protein
MRFLLGVKDLALPFMRLTRLAIACLPALLTLPACSTATIENGGGGDGAGGSGGGAGGAIVTIDLDAAVVGPDLRKADLPPDVKPYRCDDAGNCNICLAILSLGQPAKYGANSGTSDNTDAFQKFMNDNTKGTANMVMLRDFTPLTEELLSRYDVVILQALEKSEWENVWTYQQSDVDALERWVRDKGGSVIAMTGYGGNTTEVQPLNQLLAPFGISYNTPDILTEADCTDNLCYCAYSSLPFANWIADTPDCSGITVNVAADGTSVPLGKVGVFRGRSINCTGSGCNVFAKDAKSGANVGVAKLVGEGRVLAWADEWVTYTSQWGLTPDPKYDDPVVYAQCVGHTPRTSYVVPQFWNNVFKWSVPGAACFVIEPPPGSGQIVIP